MRDFQEFPSEHKCLVPPREVSEKEVVEQQRSLRSEKKKKKKKKDNKKGKQVIRIKSKNIPL